MGVVWARPAQWSGRAAAEGVGFGGAARAGLSRARTGCDATPARGAMDGACRARGGGAVSGGLVERLLLVPGCAVVGRDSYVRCRARSRRARRQASLRPLSGS